MKNMLLKKTKYKNFNIYYYEDYFLMVAKKILGKNFRELKIIKNTKRNFVSLIKIDNKKYIYKEPRNEYRIPQRQIMTLLKKGEALTTLININELINEGFEEFAKPLVAVNRRKNGLITFSFFLMEYIDGEVDRAYIDEIIEVMKKVHKRRIYHGDFNPGNFLINKSKIKIIDTQGKKMGVTKYRAHYDMITMQYDSYQEMEYPYEKDFIYYIAYFIKKFKRLSFIEKIGKVKKKLRDKGWKI